MQANRNRAPLKLVPQRTAPAVETASITATLPEARRRDIDAGDCDRTVEDTPAVEDACLMIVRMNRWCRREVSRLARLQQQRTAMQVIAGAMEAARVLDDVAPDAASAFQAGLFALAETLWDDRSGQESSALLL